MYYIGEGCEIMKDQFELVSEYKPSGDQPEAIKELVSGLKEDKKFQVLLGATGTGKTFTISNVIAQVNRPTLVFAHNKTLAGQLYSEFKEFFHIIVWNILFLILITISQKLICQKRIRILIKTRRQMKNWTCLEWQLSTVFWNEEIQLL